MFTYQTATALLICLKVHTTHLFLSFLAYCCVHFLTFVSNSSICQRPSSHALRSRRFRARGYCSRRSFLSFLRRSLYLGAKL